MAGTRARGQPLLVLALLLSGWIGARAVAWNMPPDAVEVDGVAAPLVAQEAGTERGAAVAAAPVAPVSGQAGEARVHVMVPPEPAPGPRTAPLAPMWQAGPAPLAPAQAPAPAAAAPTMAPADRMAVAGGHQLLWLAAAAMLPMPADVAAHFAAPPPRTVERLPRWSADGWLFLRRGGVPITFPRLSGGGTYGASQAGAVLRYRLAPADPHRPTAYLRGAGALNGTREQEVALGLSARPLAGLPVAAMAEVRVTRDSTGTRARPAVALVSELPPQRLPLGFTGEAYVQGGYVGGRSGTAFIDGLVRADRPVFDLAGTQLRAGAGAWGAKQRGATRLDVGPVASVRLKLGDTASARLEADWRFRVAGQAHPGSGPALTLSAGF